jgi:hypothetical protein
MFCDLLLCFLKSTINTIYFCEIDEKLEKIEPVNYSLNSGKGVFIADIYFDFETQKAVKFRRAEDSKILWIPKQFHKNPNTKSRKTKQNIQLKFKPKDLYWK